MKKILMLAAAMCCLTASVQAENKEFNHTTNSAELLPIERNIIFPSDQRMRDKNGNEIVLYASGKYREYKDRIFVAEGTYSVSDRDIHFYANGRELYMAKYKLKGKQLQLKYMVLRGIKYKRKK